MSTPQQRVTHGVGFLLEHLPTGEQQRRDVEEVGVQLARVHPAREQRPARERAEGERHAGGGQLARAPPGTRVDLGGDKGEGEDDVGQRGRRLRRAEHAEREGGAQQRRRPLRATTTILATTLLTTTIIATTILATAVSVEAQREARHAEPRQEVQRGDERRAQRRVDLEEGVPPQPEGRPAVQWRAGQPRAEAAAD